MTKNGLKCLKMALKRSKLCFFPQLDIGCLLLANCPGVALFSKVRWLERCGAPSAIKPFLVLTDTQRPWPKGAGTTMPVEGNLVPANRSASQWPASFPKEPAGPTFGLVLRHGLAGDRCAPHFTHYNPASHILALFPRVHCCST